MPWNENKFTFKLKQLPKSIYTQLVELAESSKTTQWQIIVFAIAVLYKLWKQENHTLLKETWAEVEKLQPSGPRPHKAGTREFNEEVRRENNEDLFD